MVLPLLLGAGLAATGLAQAKAPGGAAKPYTVYDGALEEDGSLAVKGARFCLKPGGTEVCWKFEDGLGASAAASEIIAAGGTKLYLFSATDATGRDGATGVALLQLQGTKLVNVGPPIMVSASSQFDAWPVASAGRLPVVVTADQIRGKDESRHDSHAFEIKIWAASANGHYSLRFKYPTRGKVQDPSKLLAHEKPAILARLQSGRTAAPGAKR
jgi:hypothetical protein